MHIYYKCQKRLMNIKNNFRTRFHCVVVCLTRSRSCSRTLVSGLRVKLCVRVIMLYQTMYFVFHSSLPSIVSVVRWFDGSMNEFVRHVVWHFFVVLPLTVRPARHTHMCVTGSGTHTHTHTRSLINFMIKNLHIISTHFNMSHMQVNKQSNDDGSTAFYAPEKHKIQNSTFAALFLISVGDHIVSKDRLVVMARRMWGWDPENWTTKPLALFPSMSLRRLFLLISSLTRWTVRGQSKKKFKLFRL